MEIWVLSLQKGNREVSQPLSEFDKDYRKDCPFDYDVHHFNTHDKE